MVLTCDIGSRNKNDWNVPRLGIDAYSMNEPKPIQLGHHNIGNDNRRACSLYLSMMDRMGVKLDKFGDTDKRLDGLWADA